MLINNDLEEIELLEKVLIKHKIYDLYVYYTPKTHKLVARDEDKNVWKEKKFYDFLFNEVFNYDENGIIDLLDKEDDERLRYFRNKHQK